MRTRIISAAVAIVVAVVLLILHNYFFFNIAIGLLTAGAIFEIFRATKHTKFTVQAWLCYAYAFLDAFMAVFHRHGWLTFLTNRMYFGLFIVGMCLCYLKLYKEYKYTDLFFMIGVTLFVSYAFETLLYMSASGDKHHEGMFMLVITLCGAWLADSGAYFAGTWFGKTPLCPEISPKKTVEGLVGGVVCNGVLMLLIGLFYDFVLNGSSLNYIVLFLAGMACALLGLVGDLTASEIKRQCEIKDYGNLMPGHGGIMDRFDSVLLVAPFMYYLFIQGWIFK